MSVWDEPIHSLPRSPRRATSFEHRLGIALWIALGVLLLTLSA